MQTWLTFSDIAEELNIPVKTIYLFHRNGQGPSSYRFGKHIRVNRSDYDAWRQSRRTGQ